MIASVLAFLAQWQYLGAFVGIFIEEAGVPLPVPGDVFIAALGASGRAGHASFLLTALVVCGATVSGSAVLFEFSRRVGRPLLDRVGRRLGFNAARVDRVERWMTSHGPVAIALGRLVPGFRIVLTVAAGTLGMGRTAFLAGAAVASVLWAAIYYWLGFLLGAGVTHMIEGAAGRAIRRPEVAAAVVVAVVLAVAAVIGTIIWRRRRAPERSTPE